MKETIYRNARSLSITWALVILFLCAVPGRYVPSSSWLELLSFDKLVHATLFFILCALMLLWRGAKNPAGPTPLMCVFLSVAYGVVLEILQAAVFVERSMDFYDAVANAAGALLAFGMRSRLRKIFTSRSSAARA